MWRGFRSALVAGVVAAAVSVWWFVRDLAVYGWPDLFGLLRHGQVVVGQPRTGAVTQATVDYFANTLFRSFWAQFGWMGILVDSRLYLVLRLLSLLAAVGLLLLAARLLTHRQGIGASDLLPLALMVVWPALLLGGLIGYNLTFIRAGTLPVPQPGLHRDLVHARPAGGLAAVLETSCPSAPPVCCWEQSALDGAFRIPYIA